MADEDQLGYERGSRPIPDPTILTTQQLLRALADMEKLFDTKLEGLRELSQVQTASSRDALSLTQAASTKLQNDLAHLNNRITGLETKLTTLAAGAAIFLPIMMFAINYFTKVPSTPPPVNIIERQIQAPG